MQKFWENLQYVVLVLLIVGQATVGSWFVLGQCVYLSANVISIKLTLHTVNSPKISAFFTTSLFLYICIISYNREKASGNIAQKCGRRFVQFLSDSEVT